MSLRDIKKALKPLRNTPLHPQWQPSGSKYENPFGELHGKILDIGCGESAIRQDLPTTSEYIGLDYYQTATEWYQTRPDIFGDAQHLPFPDRSFDHVLLLDVLEHIPDSSACLHEIRRVLRPGGKVIMQVPFIYPIHDAPLDFQRWTEFGLNRLAETHGFKIISSHSFGRPTDTAALITNLALSKLLAESLDRRSPFALFGILLPPVVLLNNLFAWMFSFIVKEDSFMPSSYQTIWELR